MRKQQKFDLPFKLKVVEEVLNGVYTKEQARVHYGIKGNSIILNWMRNYAGVYLSAPQIEFDKMKEKNQEEAKLRAEINRLKAQLAQAELKSRAYQIMVEIAKDQYNLDLEKKLGAKPSKHSKKNSQK
jgi:transposase-like protein